MISAARKHELIRKFNEERKQVHEDIQERKKQKTGAQPKEGDYKKLYRAFGDDHKNNDM
jgi:fatty acid-binding protein DegV